MRKVFALLLLLALLAGCAQEAATQLPAEAPPAWATEPAALSELLDGSLEDAVRFAVYASSGYSGDSVACGEAVPVYALRSGVWEPATSLRPFYAYAGQRPSGFLFPLEAGEVRARLSPEPVMMAWWRLDKLGAGGVCFLATAEGVVLLHESGATVPFWDEPLAGLDPAPDWESFVPPETLTLVPLAETERFSYDPEPFARYDPLPAVREMDGSWSAEALVFGMEDEVLRREPLTQAEVLQLAEALQTLRYDPPTPMGEIDGVSTDWAFELTDPQGQTWTLYWFWDLRLGWPEGRSSPCGMDVAVPLALYEAALSPARAEVTLGARTVSLTDPETLQALMTLEFPELETAQRWGGAAESELLAALRLYSRSGALLWQAEALDGTRDFRLDSGGLRRNYYECPAAAQALIELCGQFVGD